MWVKELVRRFEARCVGVRRKIRKILTKLREGTAELQVEIGRGRGLKRERKCTECDSEEVENVKCLLMKCKAWNGEREELVEKMKKVVTGFLCGRVREECGMDS